MEVTICDVGPRDGLQNEPETLAPAVRAELVSRLAAAGLGVALIPDNIVVPGIDAGVLRLEPRLLRDVAVYARVALSPTAAAFVDIVRAAASPRPGGTQTIHL